MTEIPISGFKRLVRSAVYFGYYVGLEKFYRIYEKERASMVFADANPPTVRLIDFNGVRFGMFIGAHGVIEDHILRYGNWSGDLLLVTDHFIQPGAAIIDVGANIGFESLYYGRKYPECRVYSYEPASYAYAALCTSKAYNGLDNLRVFQLGLGSQSARLALSSPTETSKNKGLGSLQPNVDVDESYRPEAIEIVTLDEHISPDEVVGLIKIDTQGHEWDVLLGAANTVKVHRPVVLFEHEDQYHKDGKGMRKQISDLFTLWGYDLYIPGAELLKHADFAMKEQWHGDVIALPRP